MEGALIVDKPSGITSHDVVSRVRRVTGTRRVGHAGTLDPFATGVLVVCVGRATRLAQFLVGLDKEYVANIRFGFATDTQDFTGKPNGALISSNELGRGRIEDVLKEFVGPQDQVPPMYSAKKIDGQRLYRAARAGLEIERKPSAIEVYSIAMVDGEKSLEHLNPDGTRDVAVTIRCSSGTYIRTLAHDIGARLGVGAHLAGLRRTAVGQFRIEMAVKLDDLEAGMVENGGSPGYANSESDWLPKAMLTPAALVSHLPAIQLKEDEVASVRNGREVSIRNSGMGLTENDMFVGLVYPGGKLIGIGEYRAGNDTIAPRVVIDAAGQEADK
jgi:tRNA pseudouridine55 synthase